MKLLFALQLALRYLKPHRTFLSIITLISIGGVVVACMALTVIMPVMSGFEKSVKERLLGSNPHALFKVSSSAQEGGAPLYNWREHLQKVREFSEVEMAFPVVEGSVFMEVRDVAGGIRRAPQLMSAVDPEDGALIDELAGSLQLEEFPASRADLSALPSQDNWDGVCLLSSLAAESMGLRPGDTVTLYSPSNLEQLVDQVESLERPSLASRVGEELLSARARMIDALLPAALDPDAAWPDPELPLGEAESVALPASVYNELYGLIESLLDNPLSFGRDGVAQNVRDEPGNLASGDGQKVRNRVGEQEDLLLARNALEEFLRVYESEQPEEMLVIFEASRENSPLADLSEILQDLGTEPTAAQEREEMQQLRDLVLPKTLEVIGVYSGVGGVSATVIVPLHIGQSLYSLEGAVHAIGVRVDNPIAVTEIQPQWAEEIEQAFGEQFTDMPHWLTESWQDRYGNLFGQIENERVMMYIILFFIMLVASFCICSNLVTTTVLKRREMGLLKAFGSPVWQISGIFVFQGVVVGALGTALGIGLGRLLLWQRNNFLDWVNATWGLDLFPADVYGLDGGIPVEYTIEQTLIVAVGAFTFSTLAALPPALIVAFSQPAASLRSQGN